VWGGGEEGSLLSLRNLLSVYTIALWEELSSRIPMTHPQNEHLSNGSQTPPPLPLPHPSITPFRLISMERRRISAVLPFFFPDLKFLNHEAAKAFSF